MRIAAFLMAALLALSLAACNMPMKNNTGNTNDNNTGANTQNPGGTSGTGNTNNNTTPPANGSTGNTDGAGNTGGNVKDEHRAVMYNGALYEVTSDRVDSGDVGVQLFSVSKNVDDTPVEEGDATGIDEGTKVFRIKDDNNYNAIAVEIDDNYYKAVKKA